MTVDSVHLVGSVPMATAEDVFRTVADALGDCISRIPDGETGERSRWVYWQRTMLENHPDMEVDPDADNLKLHEWDGTLLRETDLLRFRPGIDPTRVVFDTGYDSANLASWESFGKLQESGDIPPYMRFQVALPTPMSSAFMYLSPAAYEAYLPCYERSLLTALANIVARIPPEKLSIQWDICQEVLVMENYFPSRPMNYKQQIFAMLTRLGEAVPEPVELGYHLCYGTPRDKHLVMPKDCAILTELGNAIFDGVGRDVNYLHLPVPKARDDAAYFAPLSDLKTPMGTKIYLGLIHHDDTAGDQARIKAAHGVLKNFGVSTECGWGRGDPNRVPGYLQSHRQAALSL